MSGDSRNKTSIEIQSVFMIGRSTVGTIFLLRQLMTEFREKKAKPPHGFNSVGKKLLILFFCSDFQVYFGHPNRKIEKIIFETKL